MGNAGISVLVSILIVGMNNFSADFAPSFGDLMAPRCRYCPHTRRGGLEKLCLCRQSDWTRDWATAGWNHL